MLFFAHKVTKTKIHEFNLLILDQVHYIVSCFSHHFLLTE